ncbi:MAG: hypothetical protein RIR97_1235 [Pseudomonadota bacterium]
MMDIDTLNAGELAALLHFHAEAGVEWLVEDQAIDRFEEFATLQAARQAVARSASLPQNPVAQPASATVRPISARTAPQLARPLEPSVALPDDRAIDMAREAAGRATTWQELITELQGFSGCNLKNSARQTVIPTGKVESGVMIIGPMPTADDDRDGVPFSGRQGALLDRMLAAIHLSREDCLLTHTIAWRPPGNRMPSGPEMDICRPFIERQIALAKPAHILLLGNFATKFFIPSPENIQTLRGRWHEVQVGDLTVPALATLHPSDLIAAPISKRLAWADLLEFHRNITGAKSPQLS